MLDRNNVHSPSGPLYVTSDPDKIIGRNADIMNTWFEYWRISYVPNVMDKPKWFKSDKDLKVGDVVFLRKEREHAGNYRMTS